MNEVIWEASGMRIGFSVASRIEFEREMNEGDESAWDRFKRLCAKASADSIITFLQREKRSQDMINAFVNGLIRGARISFEDRER